MAEMTGRLAPGQEVQPQLSKSKLSLLPLMALIYFEVSGGPFGMEDAIGAGGPMMAVLGFVVLPFIWSIPEALITAELATTFPENSGFVAWVTEAFGPFVGFQEGVWSWVSGIADGAIYPVLLLDYMAQIWHPLGEGVLRHVLIILIATGLAYINYRGLAVVAKAAVFIAIFSLVPFVVMVFFSIPQIDPSQWHAHIPTTTELRAMNWPIFINTIFWKANYWDAASSIVGEVDNPSRTFPKALIYTVILMIAIYCIPLIAVTGVCIPDQELGGCLNYSRWHDGYYSHVALFLGGKWLQILTVICAALSNIGLYEAELSCFAYQLGGMADRRFVPSIFGRRSRYDTPTYSILICLVGICILSSSKGFSEIVELMNFLYCLASLMAFAAFLWLRYKRPGLHRPYRFPAPLPVLCLILLPALALVIFVLSMAALKTVLIAFSISVLGCALYPVLCYLRDHQLVQFESGGNDEKQPLLRGIR